RDELRGSAQRRECALRHRIIQQAPVPEQAGHRTGHDDGATGRARLATNPLPTGSEIWMKTTGCVLVCRRSSANAAFPTTTITSGFARSSSSAAPAISSELPAPQ